MKTNKNELIENCKFNPDFKAQCPSCHQRMKGAVDPTGLRGTPVENDLAICPFCGKPAKFNAELELVVINVSELNPIERLLVSISQSFSKKVNAELYNN